MIALMLHGMWRSRWGGYPVVAEILSLLHDLSPWGNARWFSAVNRFFTISEQKTSSTLTLYGQE